jgi:hypothetical protein
MSIGDDIAFLERVPTLGLPGREALEKLAAGRFRSRPDVGGGLWSNPHRSLASLRPLVSPIFFQIQLRYRHGGDLDCALSRQGTETMLALIFSAIAAFVAAIIFLIGTAPGSDRWAVRRRLRPVFETYRPELHYMRGPGPKWREKHVAASRGRS